MNPANSVPGSQRKRRTRTGSFTMPAVFATVPPRVFGHALVVVLCLVVAYVGRTNRLSDQIGFSQLSPDGSRPTPQSLNSGLVATDSLVRPPAAEQAGPAPQRLQVTHYEAQPGDTVAALADRFDISENTIIWTNNLPPDGHLEAGHELVILPVSGILYTVQDGQTLADIAQRFQSQPDAIALVNQLDNTSQPPTGTQLIIPGGRLDPDPRMVVSAATVSRPNVARADNATADVTPSAAADETQPRSAFDVSSAVDLIRRLPFVKTSEPAPPPPAPTTPLAPIVYVVADGDTLSSIASKYGVSADAIAAASGIEGGGDAISINQKLLIPPVPGVLHTVQEGDTLGQVAEKYGASESDIVRANVLSEPYMLKIGQVLVVPGGSLTPAPASEQVTETNYQVQDGDSLSSIAQAFGVELRAVIDANGLQDPYLLHPGQQLMIRGATHIASPSDIVAPRADSHPVVAAPVPVPAVASAPAPVAAPTQAPRRVVAPVPVAAPARANSGSGWGIVDVASRYLGTPYVWGGTAPGGFDCSGFVWYTYRRAGVPIPRDMWGQLQSGSRVSRSNLQPGDIVFFAGTYEAGLSHDGIYIGGGRFIHAADYGIGVIVSSFSNSYYANHYFGATRPW